MRKILALLFILIIGYSCSFTSQPENKIPDQILFKDVQVNDELSIRANKNFDRLETDIYSPENVFPKKHHISSQGWPGDKEGRTILGLVMEAQATHREPLYLNEMIRIIPSKLNNHGYLGPLQGDTINEQQLSGHGWFLRGLCEYYIWKQDPNVKRYILDIIQNLALPTKGFHKNYPISIEDRRANVGEMAGTTQNVINNWLLSSDIGCDFIFLDGVVQAYALFPSKELKDLIDEMVNRFLEIDLVSIKAQTHATLTGLRALVRYFEITNNTILLTEVEKRYKLYREFGMTENYENFNWFGRPEWTEPCAIIDSYMLAVQLWQHTQNPEYLEDAHHIYYNAICHTQRSNGGFGCDNCPSSDDVNLKVKAYEAFWCCTMRGGEGLARAIQYSYFTKDNDIYVPFFHGSNASLILNNTTISLEQKTDYPLGTNVSFAISAKNGPAEIILHLFAPEWTNNQEVFADGKKIKFTQENSFLLVPLKIKGNTKVNYSFEMKTQTEKVINNQYSGNDIFSIEYGPLILGYQGESEVKFGGRHEIVRTNDTLWQVTDNDKTYDLTPVYHLLDENVKEKTYQKQILFR